MYRRERGCVVVWWTELGPSRVPLECLVLVMYRTEISLATEQTSSHCRPNCCFFLTINEIRVLSASV
jgi:hypothetical protein